MHLLPLGAHEARRATAAAARSALPGAPRVPDDAARPAARLAHADPHGPAPAKVVRSRGPGLIRRRTAALLRRAADRLAPVPRPGAYHAPDAGQGPASR